MHAYLDSWEPNGFGVAMRHRPILENWIEAWAKARGLLPEEAGVASAEAELLRAFPGNPYLSYHLPADSDLTETDVAHAIELAEHSEQLRLAIAARQLALDEPGLLRRVNDAINPYADPEQRRRDLQWQIWDLESQLEAIEDQFRQLGYDRIEWFEPMAFGQSGIRAAESARHADREPGLRSVTVETVMTVTSIAALTKISAKLIARGSARLARRLTSRASSELEDIVIDTYRNLSRREDLPGQSHHLNQTAAYGSVIPRQEGLSIKLEGNIFTEPGAQHTRAHRSLEEFWFRFRSTMFVPTNTQYTLALRHSLRAAGLSEPQVQLAVRAAIRERVNAGLLGGLEVPQVPMPIKNLAR